MSKKFKKQFLGINCRPKLSVVFKRPCLLFKRIFVPNILIILSNLNMFIVNEEANATERGCSFAIVESISMLLPYQVLEEKL